MAMLKTGSRLPWIRSPFGAVGWSRLLQSRVNLFSFYSNHFMQLADMKMEFLMGRIFLEFG